MSNQFNEFDQVLRDRLREHAVSPPDSVWEEISAKRNYGHLVANRISKYWRTFGTLLLLLLAGGSTAILIGGDEESLASNAKNPEIQLNDQLKNQPTNHQFNVFTQQNSVGELSQQSTNNQIQKSSVKDQQETTIVEHEKPSLDQRKNNIPDAELMASMEAAAFSRPELQDDPLLNIYISHLDGWESAKPISFIRYDEMNKSTSKGFYNPVKSAEPIRAGEVVYEYAFPTVDKKPFKERASLYIAFTPQHISKYMTPEFDVSSNYLKQRAESETPRMAYTVSANLHYELKNHKFIETGINFTQIYEEMHYQGEKRFSNQYDFVEVPLLLGYEARNSKWGWQIKGGLGVQLFNNYKGYILKVVDDENIPPTSPEPDEPMYRMRSNDAIINIVTNNHKLSKNQERHTVANLENKDENPFKTSGVVNVHLAAGVTYYHSIRTTFVLTPHYSRSINSITNGDARFQERISYMGVSFGGRFNF